MRYATRVNSFMRAEKDIVTALKKISGIDGIDYVDLNYPEHFMQYPAEKLREIMKENELKCNAVNLRFREKFLGGEFGNRDLQVSKDAVALCKEAIRACEELGGRQLIIWLGFDGYDYSFQMNYTDIWNRLVACFREVCDATDLAVSIEYKPYDERVHCFLDSFGTTMLMVKDIDRKNLGVTLDFCHMLMKKENPAFAASWLLSQNKLYNMHLNDGEGSTDDGLMVGTVHFWKTVEIMYYLKKYDFQGVVYFDTFPKREEAVAECESNIKMCRKIESMIEQFGMDRINEVIEDHDGISASRMMVELLG